jgi:hypothetical protein
MALLCYRSAMPYFQQYRIVIEMRENKTVEPNELKPPPYPAMLLTQKRTFARGPNSGFDRQLPANSGRSPGIKKPSTGLGFINH